MKELSLRQKETISLREKGLPVKEIAKQLAISVNTVNYHLKKVRKKDTLSIYYPPTELSLYFKWLRNKKLGSAQKYQVNTRVEKAVANSALCKLYKKILLQRYGKEWLSIKDIAQKHKKSNVAVRILLSRARRQLSKTPKRDE